jgi:hypothetical protein
MIDREIWKKLGLSRARYFVYRAKLYRLSGKLFEKTTNDELIYHKELLQERLTRIFRQMELDLTQTSVADNGYNNKDRAATALAAQNIAINIFKLEHEGLRVLSQSGFQQNRYLRRASSEAESGRKVRILPGYTEEGGRTRTLIRQEGITSDTNPKPDESEVY